MKVNATCNSISIAWSAPNYTGGVPLQKYTVKWIGRGSSLMTDVMHMTAWTVAALTPSTSYSINVIAVNAIGEREGSDEIGANTISQGWCKVQRY